MLGKGRRTIGVFATQAHQEFQDLLCRGICSRAYDLGYNVAIFSNFLGYGELNYEIGESKIANLPSYKNLSGIIMLPDTMFVKDFKSNIEKNIEKYADCPVVSVRQYMEGHYNVLIEDENVLEEIINHFIEHHKFTKINMLTGPKDNPVSIQRLGTYKRLLRENGIPVEEDRIIYGDFWKFSAEEAVDKWLSNSDKYPEAIVCANDYMAMSVCNVLAERGVLVPREIAVSGCDNIEMTKDFIPPITTVGMPVFDMGMEAVNKIHRENQGLPQDSISYLKSITYIRESCGCSLKDNTENLLRRRNDLLNEVEDKDQAISNNAYMSIDMTGVTLQEDFNNKVAAYTYLNKDFASFYMCLFKDWDKYLPDEDFGEIPSSGEITMEMGMKNGEWLQKVQFDIKELLPAIYIDEDPHFFYFNMLHHREKCYGYTAINFNRFQAFKPSYQGWLINVCNALENIKTHSELNRLVYRLEDMSIKDELTGLYNRRALHTLGQVYLEQSIENNSSIMVFSADMDNLKYINDNYGHGVGDLALKGVANALMYASEDDEICIRMGGDEFTVIGVEYDEQKMDRFLERFYDALNEFNESNKYHFSIRISVGWNITLANKDTNLEECHSIADARMYQQKHEKEVKGLRHKK